MYNVVKLNTCARQLRFTRYTIGLKPRKRTEEIKYLKTTLLLEPDNEEALYMLIDIELKKSNFSEVKKLTKNFEIVCSTLCDKTKNINERLKNIDTKDESKQ